MNKLATLALCALGLGAVAVGCSNDPTVENGGATTTGSNITFVQIAREGRPGVKELYLPYAAHDAFNRTTPASDATSGPLIGTFVTGTAGRSTAIATYVQTLLTPDALLANLSDGSTRASYLGFETGGTIAADCTGLGATTFGGRALTDDVVNVMLGLSFGNLATAAHATTPIGTPGIGATPPPDDGHEQNGQNGTPNLTNQNVSCTGKGFSNGAFPYLAPPI